LWDVHELKTSCDRVKGSAASTGLLYAACCAATDAPVMFVLAFGTAIGSVIVGAAQGFSFKAGLVKRVLGGDYWGPAASEAEKKRWCVGRVVLGMVAYASIWGEIEARLIWAVDDR
jgi:hypothetical protein